MSHAAFGIEKGTQFPPIQIKHHQSGAIDPTTLKEKVTIINFWATWCEACKVELVEFEDYLRPYLNEDAFQVAFVSLDKEPAKAVEWFQSNMKEPDTYMKHLYVDPSFAAADVLAVDSFPMTLVIGKDGKVVYVQKGFKEGEGTTEKLIKVAADLLK
jgi:thiol-disulfide isomerase/thioredoxin